MQTLKVSIGQCSSRLMSAINSRLQFRNFET